MEGTSDGQRGFWERRAFAGAYSGGGQLHRNVEEESGRRTPTQGADVRYCKRQHDVFVTYIRYAFRDWRPLDEAPLSYWMDGTVSPWTGSSAIPVTPELRRVLTRAKILCDDCCRELPPLKAALRHAERSEAFADVLKEVRWCASVVHNGSVCRNVEDWAAPELKDFPWQARLGRQEQRLLQKAEQEDWRELLQELASWSPGHVCSAEECGNMHAQRDPEYCLSTQMLARYPAQELRIAHGEDSVLWSFDKEVLQHGPPLGSGSFGAVSEVTWLGCKYAQKVFNLADDHSLRAEMDASVKVNHPHIVKVFAHSEDSLLMDVMCIDLHRFMKMRRRKRPSMVGPFSLAAAIDLMLQIADAMSYTHSQKLAHRDLKSSNILVNPLSTSGLVGDDDDDGFVFAKIADFGLAKVKREMTRYSHLTPNVGTRRWMAPEIFSANREDDHRLEAAFPMKADVYSFGVLCFEILSGEEPYSDVRVSELYAKLTAPFPLRPRLPASCPTGLASLICACWDADPRKRPEFADACRVLRYLKGIPTLIDLGDKSSIDGEWPFGRLKPLVKTKDLSGDEDTRSAPWLLSPRVEDVKGFRVDFADREKRVLSACMLATDASMRASVSDSGRSTGWILFDQPSEFLVRVEVILEEADQRFGESVRAITYTTTTQSYGPFGTVRSWGKWISSLHGRVVVLSVDLSAQPFWNGKFSGRTRNRPVCSVMPEIVQCLRHWLDGEELFA